MIASSAPRGRRLIAFLQFVGPGQAEIVAVSALGGGERKLGETRSILTAGFFPGHHLVSLVARWTNGFVSLIGTRPNSRTDCSCFRSQRGKAAGYTYFFGPGTRSWLGVFSERAMAFLRNESLGVSDIYLVGLSADYVAHGEPRRLTSDRLRTTAVAWLPNSTKIPFTSGAHGSDRGIFKMDISGRSKKEQLPGSGEDAYDIAMALGGGRIAYTRRLQDSNIWRVDLTGRGIPPRRVLASTRNDQVPSISPDGKRAAFSSGRSGTREIWVADADGTGRCK